LSTQLLAPKEKADIADVPVVDIVQQPSRTYADKGRFQQLDLLRALAISLVLFRHMSLLACSPHSVFGVMQNTIFRGGWIGVDIFFVLSGFLVSGLLFREYQKYGAISFRQFFLRRGFKIYPAYWAMLSLGAIVAWCFGHAKPFSTYLISLLFLQNYGPFVWAPTWSLAVEEHFYITLPLLLMALIAWRKTKPFISMPLIFVGITAACTTMRVLHGMLHPFSQEGSVFPTHLRIDSLMFGVLISYWYHFHNDTFARITRDKTVLFGILGAAMLIPAFVWDQAQTPFIYTFGYNLLYLGSGFLLVSSLSWKHRTSGLIKGIAAIGGDSYSIYLWHPIVNLFALGILCDASPLMWGCYLCAYLAGSIVFGTFMARVVEKPALALRDRLVPSRAR